MYKGTLELIQQDDVRPLHPLRGKHKISYMLGPSVNKSFTGFLYADRMDSEQFWTSTVRTIQFEKNHVLIKTLNSTYKLTPSGEV